MQLIVILSLCQVHDITIRRHWDIRTSNLNLFGLNQVYFTQAWKQLVLQKKRTNRSQYFNQPASGQGHGGWLQPSHFRKPKSISSFPTIHDGEMGDCLDPIIQVIGEGGITGKKKKSLVKLLCCNNLVLPQFFMISICQ